MSYIMIPQPFAENGNRNTIENNRQSGQSPEDATWNDGFPHVTMTPITAGGLPPKGLDVNGILHAISSHLVHLQAGGRYKFDAAFSTLNGGYPVGAVLSSDDGTKDFLCTQANNTNNPNINTTGWRVYSGAGHIHTWEQITGKPTSFNPATHSHQIANITGLQGILDSKAEVNHTHTIDIANVTNLQTELDTKAKISESIRIASTIPSTKTLGEVMYSRSMQSLLQWQTIGAWSGYASNQLGSVIQGSTNNARVNELNLIGGTVSKTTYPALWAWAQANGHVVPAASWQAKTFKFVDVNSSTFRLPDLRDVFIRFTGTDADSANVRALGSYQADEIRAHTHAIGTLYYNYNGSSVATNASNGNRTETAPFGGAETRGENVALAPRIIAY